MRKYIPVVLWLLSVSAILVFSDTVSDVTYSSLEDAIKEVFPVLFPYSVIASLMVSTGGGELLGKLIPINRLFLAPSSASAPMICGAVCGFPLGAKTACDMYEYGSFSKKNAEKIISISNNTGPAFVVSIIGAKFFSSVEVGIVIYLSQFLSVIITSLAVNGRIDEDTVCCTNKVPLGKAFSDAVRSSFISCLYVCGFISVFSSILYGAARLPKGIYGALCALLEFTNGARYGGNVGGEAGLFIAAFSVGWSGLSVLAQTMSYTCSLGLSILPLVRIKIISGLLCGLICALYFSPIRPHMLTSLCLLTVSLYIIRSGKGAVKSKIREN